MWQYEADALIKSDQLTDKLKAERPAALPIDGIKQSPAVFQVRREGLLLRPGQSAKHVETLAKVAKGGQPLDPVTIVAFGNECFLVDGHHRIGAYRLAKWNGDVPVAALQSDLSGLARVLWAAQASLSENRKDRLNITEADKQDAAWRAVVQDYGSKQKTARDHGVSESQIANMRKVKQDLLELGGEGIASMTCYGWRRAGYELRRRKDNGGPPNFDYQDRLRRELAKRLKPILDMRPSAETLLDLLELARPGITIELESAIIEAKAEAARPQSSLEI